MIFNSFQFVWLFPLIFALYWLLDRLGRHRHGHAAAKYFLLAVSYGLYAQWSLPYTLILFGVTAITYIFGRIIENKRAYGCRKYIIWAGALLTLCPLLVFKYFNFITDAGASALQWIGIDAAAPALRWVVPLGLSFYTFQALGYLWDVYYRKFPAEHNFGDYMLFVAFFPQILCGPISRAEELMPQIKRCPPFNYSRAVSGLKYLLWGMFLKVAFADRLGVYVDTVYADPAKYSGSSNLLASIFYSLQIYGDFAGYSFMALGVARLLGFDIIKNFNRPYLATSITGFWKRWNISLTRWLTTYIYIPQGGSRRGRLRTYFNILLTFLVSGIWHGAAWTFIFWGMIHGAAQCVEKFFGLNASAKGFLKVAGRIALTFTIVNFAWIFFRLPTIGEGFYAIRHIFSDFGIPYIHPTTFFHLAVIAPIVFAADILREFKPGAVAALNRHAIVRWGAYILLAVLIMTFGVLDSGQFIYVSF